MPKTTAAILLSRQPLRPTGKTSWVRQSVEAVRWLSREGYVLCSSLGMQTWELLTSIGSIEQTKQTLFVPATSSDEFERLRESAIVQFDLNSTTVSFIPIISEEKGSTKEDLWLKRDKAVVEAADLIVPISLRRGGHMDLLTRQLSVRGKSVEERFRIDYEQRTEPLAYTIRTEKLNPELLQIEDHYLIHWTRASNSGWPTERSIDYYKAVIESDSYPRSAFCTLVNILSTKKIVATPKNMPQGLPTVSLSALAPVDVLPLIRWRSRFREMSFEPYGIGIEKEYALSHGIFPVQYYDKNLDHATTNNRWLEQSVGAKSDWRAEQEYRHKGDFDFVSIPSNLLLAFCHTRQEAEIIENTTGVRAVSFLQADASSFQ